MQSLTACGGKLVEEVPGEEGERLRNMYYMFSDGAIRFLPEGWILPHTFLRYSDQIYSFEVKPDDIYVMSFPKSGTTWAQEIVWNLVHNPDLDKPEANQSLDSRFPNLEADMFLALPGAIEPDPNGDPMRLFKEHFPGKHYLEGLLLHLVSICPPPRMIKTHVPLGLLSPKLLDVSKVLYIARDPRDVIVSLFHFMRLQKVYGFTGTLDQFLDDVLNDTVVFGPYWKQLKLAWDRRDHSNVCFLFYEDMKTNIEEEAKKIDKFLGTNRSDKQIQNIIHHSSFSQMKERLKNDQPCSNMNSFFNKDVEKKEGGFFRKGISGDWKNKFSPEQVDKIHAWMEKNLPQFGEDFKYKI